MDINIQIKNEPDVDIDDFVSITSNCCASIDPSTSCRGCLQKGVRMQRIFDDGLCIFNMLRELTPVIRLSPDDDLPQQMCDACVQQLKDAIEFKKQIESVDTMLRDKENVEKADILFEDLINPIGPQMHISIANSNYNNEIGKEVEAAAGKIKSKVQKSVRLDTNSKDHRRMASLLICDICASSFRRKDAIINHMEYHVSSMKFFCRKCNQTFANDAELTKHMPIHDTKQRTIHHKCITCHAHFAFIEDLKLHASVHPKNGIWRCNNCQKIFKRKSELKQHIVFHLKEKPFQCGSCDKRFAKKDSLSNHLKRHVGIVLPKRYECKICHNKYPNLHKLKIHNRMHTGEKPFQCKDCEKSFHSAPSLRSHQRIHEDNKDHVCSHCNKGFKHASSLTYHTRSMHTGERPYKCKLCPMAFCQSSKLDRHQTVHNKSKTAICT